MTLTGRVTAGAILVMALTLIAPGTASATSVLFTATDLADAVAGEDLWQYEFAVSGATFNPDEGIAFFFDPTLYAGIANELSSADWDILVLQPDSVLPAPGVYDALSLASPASLGSPFLMSFQWLGGPAGPGSTPFELYRLGGEGEIEVFEQGRTASLSTVPEPGTLVLLGTGVCGLGLIRRRAAREAR